MADVSAAETALVSAIAAVAKSAEENAGGSMAEHLGSAAASLASALKDVHEVRDRKPGRVGSI